MAADGGRRKLKVNKPPKKIFVNKVRDFTAAVQRSCHDTSERMIGSFHRRNVRTFSTGTSRGDDLNQWG